VQINWDLSKWQFVGLALYSSAFPLGVFFQNQHYVPIAVLLSLVNLPFLVILAPLLMLAEPFHGAQFLFHFLAWTVIFAQSYLAFVYLRRRAASKGISPAKALVLSLGWLGILSSIAPIIGVLAVVLLLRMP